MSAVAVVLAVTGAEIATVLTGAGVLAGAVFGGVRELRKDKTTAAETETARAMSSQTTLIATLQAEITRVQDEFADARAEWRKERDELRAEISALTLRIRELERP